MVRCCLFGCLVVFALFVCWLVCLLLLYYVTLFGGFVCFVGLVLLGLLLLFCCDALILLALLLFVLMFWCLGFVGFVVLCSDWCYCIWWFVCGVFMFLWLGWYVTCFCFGFRFPMGGGLLLLLCVCVVVNCFCFVSLVFKLYWCRFVCRCFLCFCFVLSFVL